MSTYNYALSDFAHGISLDLLGRQIVDAVPAFVPAYQGGTVSTDVQIYFASDLTPTEQTELDGIVAAHNPTGYSFAPNYRQDTYNAARRLQATTWYAMRENDGTLLYKVEGSTYTYDAAGVYLLSEIVTTYNPLGSVVTQKTYLFETITNPDGSIYVQRNEA